MKRGTIILVPFPFTDLSAQKVRPGLVLAHPKNSRDAVIAFISTATSKRPGRYEIPLTGAHPDFAITGLKRNSIIRLDKIATLDTKTVLGELGRLHSTMQQEVDKKLRVLFNL
jgi:mRNA interferase MazF